MSTRRPRSAGVRSASIQLSRRDSVVQDAGAIDVPMPRRRRRMLLLWLSVRCDEVGSRPLCSMCSVPVRTPILEHRGDPGGVPRE